MIDLVSYLVKDFALGGLDKLKHQAEDQVKKLGDMMKQSIEEGVHNAVASVMPLVMKTGLYLIGGAFFLYGLARIIDTLTQYEGLGFMIVGCVGLIVALMIKGKKTQQQSQQ